MESEVLAMTFDTIITNVGSLTGALETMFTTLSAHWFVFLPIMMMVWKFLFGGFKSLLMYRRRRGR